MKLEVRSLAVSYEGNRIIEDISMQVKEGEFITILGPSGCGKSTLLNVISGLLKADSGEILVDNEKVEKLSSHFAYMPQQDLLLPWKNIIENVCLYGKIHHKYKEIEEIAKENFVKFGLDGYQKKYPEELSGGMRQRAAFLRTTLCEADIMLLDEPFGALDVITRSDMQSWLLNLRQTINKTTVLVTHDIDEAIYLSDRILVMNGYPSKFIKELPINEENRNRKWLFAQHELKSQIYSYLKGEA